MCEPPLPSPPAGWHRLDFSAPRDMQGQTRVVWLCRDGDMSLAAGTMSPQQDQQQHVLPPVLREVILTTTMSIETPLWKHSLGPSFLGPARETKSRGAKRDSRGAIPVITTNRRLHADDGRVFEMTPRCVTKQNGSLWLIDTSRSSGTAGSVAPCEILTGGGYHGLLRTAARLKLNDESRADALVVAPTRSVAALTGTSTAASRERASSPEPSPSSSSSSSESDADDSRGKEEEEDKDGTTKGASKAPQESRRDSIKKKLKILAAKDRVAKSNLVLRVAKGVDTGEGNMNSTKSRGGGGAGGGGGRGGRGGGRGKRGGRGGLGRAAGGGGGKGKKRGASKTRAHRKKRSAGRFDLSDDEDAEPLPARASAMEPTGQLPWHDATTSADQAAASASEKATSRAGASAVAAAISAEDAVKEAKYATDAAQLFEETMKTLDTDGRGGLQGGDGDVAFHEEARRAETGGGGGDDDDDADSDKENHGGVLGGGNESGDEEVVEAIAGRGGRVGRKSLPSDTRRGVPAAKRAAPKRPRR